MLAKLRGRPAHVNNPDCQNLEKILEVRYGVRPTLIKHTGALETYLKPVLWLGERGDRRASRYPTGCNPAAHLRARAVLAAGRDHAKARRSNGPAPQASPPLERVTRPA